VRCMLRSTLAKLSACLRTNKPGIAARYGVGVRTIESWLAWGIIQGRMERGEILMAIEDCDARLMQYSAEQRKKKGAANDQ
jgi:hypothetical protein